MPGNLKFYYFGDDEAYYKTLVGEFGRNTRANIEFQRIFESTEQKIQSLFIKIFREKPACVFIDFSKHTQEYLHLARIISRTQLEHKLVTVGLVDYLSPPEILKESVATGVNFTHIKSAESFDVIYGIGKILFPNEIPPHGFANATVKEDWEAGIPVKVGYIYNEGIHFETDRRLEKGNRIRIDHHWTSIRTVPSKEFFVQNITSNNLFYHFKYAVDAEFLFIDEFLPPEGMAFDEIDEKKKEREELIVYHQKMLSKWIDDNVSRSLEKKAKVLIVDRKFHFYDNQPRTDKHPYTLRCLPYIEDIGAELNRLEPQVIAYSLEDEKEPGIKNTIDHLTHLINAIKNKFSDTSPFIVVFNSKMNSKMMQENFKYAHIMATESDISTDVLLRMADIYEKKLIGEIIKPQKKSQQKVFLKKTNTASIAEILIPLKVQKVSETDMIFQCDVTLEAGTNMHFKKPLDMYINVQPTKNPGIYQGLIHSIGEEEKMELRRFVNSVFFRDHDAQVNAETEEFKKLNEAKLLEKQEALKKTLEEAEAKKAQEEAKKEPESSES